MIYSCYSGPYEEEVLSLNNISKMKFTAFVLSQQNIHPSRVPIHINCPVAWITRCQVNGEGSLKWQFYSISLKYKQNPLRLQFLLIPYRSEKGERDNKKVSWCRSPNTTSHTYPQYAVKCTPWRGCLDNWRERQTKRLWVERLACLINPHWQICGSSGGKHVCNLPEVESLSYLKFSKRILAENFWLNLSGRYIISIINIIVSCCTGSDEKEDERIFDGQNFGCIETF